MKQIKKYINTRTAIHCSTIEESEAVNLLFEKEELRNLHKYWKEYTNNTCYSIETGVNGYCYKEWFEAEQYRIIPASEFLQTKPNNTMKHTFKSGASFEGTKEELQAVAKALGESISPIYRSVTKGDIPVDEIHENHLKNAILSHCRDFYTQKNFKYLSNEEFLERFEEKDETINMLLTELKSRI
mgnify:FL=1